ncbi:MAG TPA: NAD(P)H-dependent oxidoreductase [Candidatus Angelobacter sp.]
MSQILLITSSPRAGASYSTQVAHALAKNLISKHKDSTLIVRDLAGDPPQHIDDSFAAARNTPREQLFAVTERCARAVGRADLGTDGVGHHYYGRRDDQLRHSLDAEELHRPHSSSWRQADNKYPCP